MSSRQSLGKRIQNRFEDWCEAIDQSSLPRPVVKTILLLVLLAILASSIVVFYAIVLGSLWAVDTTSKSLLQFARSFALLQALEAFEQRYGAYLACGSIALILGTWLYSRRDYRGWARALEKEWPDAQWVQLELFSERMSKRGQMMALAKRIYGGGERPNSMRDVSLIVICWPTHGTAIDRRTGATKLWRGHCDVFLSPNYKGNLQAVLDSHGVDALNLEQMPRDTKSIAGTLRCARGVWAKMR